MKVSRAAWCWLLVLLLPSLACGNTASPDEARTEPTLRPTFTQMVPADTPLPPAPTSPPPSDTPLPPTDTPPSPTDTPAPVLTDTIPPPSSTPVPPTDTVQAPTNTPIPPTATVLPTQPPPTQPPAAARVIIVTVDKRAEFVDIQNIGGQPQNLDGWRLVSEKGNQECRLAGTLQPGATLRIWARSADADKGGYNCGFGDTIWNNEDPDPAVLYDAQGQEVSRK